MPPAAPPTFFLFSSSVGVAASPPAARSRSVGACPAGSCLIDETPTREREKGVDIEHASPFPEDFFDR